MFDKLGWKAEYEPAEINGYNPDFIIRCDSPFYKTNSIIVEVKPSIMIDDSFLRKTHTKYGLINAHVLILDEMPFRKAAQPYRGVTLGVGWQACPGDNEFDVLEFHMKHTSDFGSQYMSFDGMVSGQGGTAQRNWFASFEGRDYFYLIEKWKEAANEVMFEVKQGKNG